MFSFFKRGREDHSKKIEQIKISIKNSFLNVKQDMNHLVKSIEHSHNKHNEHSTRFNHLLERLEIIERAIINTKLSGKTEEITSIKPKSTRTKIDTSWEGLTDIQKLICFKLAALQKESPNIWIPFKNFTREVYPTKDQKAVKSTISEYTDLLEELGFLKKKRKGRQTYLKSTDKNPYSEKTVRSMPKKTKKGKIKSEPQR